MLCAYRTDVPHGIKVKVVVGLSTKIKKIPGKGVWGGRFFFFYYFPEQPNALLFSSTIMTSTAA